MSPRPGPSWAPEEIEVLKELFATGKFLPEVTRELNARFGTKRTQVAVDARARKLRINRRRWKWRPEVEEGLYSLWGLFTAAEVARRLNGRFGLKLTTYAVKSRAAELGLSITDAQGDLTLSDAAGVLGITDSMVGKLVASGQLKAYGRGHARYVTLEDVERLKPRYERPPEPTIDVVEAGKRLGYSAGVISHQCKDGKIRGWLRLGKWHVSIAHVNEILAARAAAEPERTAS